MKPLNDQVLVEAVFEDKSAGGVLLPDTAKEQGQTRKGKVIEVGIGKLVEGATGFYYIPITGFQEGSIVWFDVYSASRVDSDDPMKPRFLVAANRILAVQE